MLRRTQSIALKVEREPIGEMRAQIERAFAPSETSMPQNPQPQALQVESATEDATPPKFDPTFVPKVERRKAERRGMDALRDEALRAVISKVQDRNFGGLRNRTLWGRGMNPSRFVLLAVALLAGGLAAFLATQENPAVAEPILLPVAPPVTQVVPEARTRILVARDTIGIGQRLSAALVEWADWPEGAVRPEYITVGAVPGAITDMAGSVARFEFFPGEPIREQKLALPGEGYLSAVLEGGMRGVSVSVAAESASGGFIVPNDHVDVVLTRATSTGKLSDTILHNVRVLAINARLGGVGADGEAAAGDPQAEIFSDVAIATLELDPIEAEVIINATTIGTLALVLRPTVDIAESGRIEQRATNLAIRLSSPFWADNSGGGAE